MAYLSKIEWCHHTFNAWWGCAKVPNDPACHNCYAETWAKRTGFQIWGQSKPRRMLSDAQWRKPLKWNREAADAGERHRVFCSSMADVFEDRDDLADARSRLWELIEATPSLDWLLLTKRPENFGMLRVKSRHNVWLGVTAATQKHYQERVPLLTKRSAAVHFVSMEPVRECIDLQLDKKKYRPDWVIVGGESGPRARETDERWLQKAAYQCVEAGVPIFVKQMGSRLVRPADQLGINLDGMPVCAPVKLEDNKGGDPDEWIEALRRREFPEAA